MPVTQNVPVITVDSILPIDGATGVNLPVELSWQAINLPTSFHITITDSSNNVIVNTTTTNYYYDATTLNDNETYSWSVYGSNSYGDGLAATSSFTTATPLPPNQVINLTVDDANILNPVFNWSSSANASNYHIKIIDNMAQTIIDQDVSGLTFTPASPLYYETAYTVDVTAINSSGTSPDDTVAFTTGAAPVTAAPTSLVPASGTTGSLQSPILSWNSPYNLFEVDIATDSAFTNIVNSGAPTTDSYPVPATLDYSTKYYWRVRAKVLYNEGTLAKYSDYVISDFTVKSIPLPTNPTVTGTVTAVNTVGFSWPSVTYASSYNVTVTRSSDSSVVYQKTGATGLSVSLPSSYYADTFTCDVYAVNSTGQSAVGTANVTTGAAPVLGVPGSLVPANSATGIVQVPDYSWSAVSTVDSYDIQIATDSAFTNIVDTTNTASTSYVSSKTLTYDTIYYVRVRSKKAYNEGNLIEYSNWSSVNEFTIMLIPVPVEVGTITITYPVENDIPEFDWGTVAHAANYHIKIVKT